MSYLIRNYILIVRPSSRSENRSQDRRNMQLTLFRLAYSGSYMVFSPLYHIDFRSKYLLLFHKFRARHNLSKKVSFRGVINLSYDISARLISSSGYAVTPCIKYAQYTCLIRDLKQERGGGQEANLHSKGLNPIQDRLFLLFKGPRGGL